MGAMYHYRVKALAQTQYGELFSDWSPWLQSRQLDASGDWDNDGLPDGWEGEHGLNPLNGQDAGEDSDGDGMPNDEEYSAGTEPNNRSSSLCIMNCLFNGTSDTVTWQGGSDVIQYLEYSDDLLSNDWKCIYTNHPPTRANNSLEIERNTGTRVYRLRVTR